ncbi:hypothetical protein GDO81_014611 [Engystomops pustulosus]|uniref:TIL domain-containing protein n=1 Tax=Engystomops pustulosus TaxID=76066 RepID=A0AAV7BBM8_ENGPU|nr:hypothetical protein GDO81_014611 [Engystomops pustulosus]
MIWNPCSGCDDYCPVSGEKCIKKCRKGCVCKDKDHRLSLGKCIYKSSCEQTSVFVPSCPRNTRWHPCAPCEPTAFLKANAEESCTRLCMQEPHCIL